MSEQHVTGSSSHAGQASPQDDEPKTPMWLPAVGAALFVGAALWWAVTPSGSSTASAEPAPSAASTASASAAAPNPQAQALPQARPGAPALPSAPAGSVQAGRIPMPSALPAELQKRINDLRGKQRP